VTFLIGFAGGGCGFLNFLSSFVDLWPFCFMFVGWIVCGICFSCAKGYVSGVTVFCGVSNILEVERLCIAVCLRYWFAYGRVEVVKLAAGL
jgi:hypothetical protein